MKVNTDYENFPLITREDLARYESSKCPCCGDLFTVDMKPEMTGRCHTGPVFVSHWQGWLYISCGQCRKPIGKIEIK